MRHGTGTGKIRSVPPSCPIEKQPFRGILNQITGVPEEFVHDQHRNPFAQQCRADRPDAGRDFRAEPARLRSRFLRRQLN